MTLYDAVMLPYTRLVSVSCLPCLPDATTTLSSPIPQAQAAARAKSGPRDQSLTVLHASPRVSAAASALATALPHSHIMTYKPNSVKDNKDRCCRPGLGERALSVLTRGERNFIDRQHRKGKTFVAVVRAAGIRPIADRYMVT